MCGLVISAQVSADISPLPLSNRQFWNFDQSSGLEYSPLSAINRSGLVAAAAGPFMKFGCKFSSPGSADAAFVKQPTNVGKADS